MSPRNVTEEEFKRLVQNRDRDPVERVRGTAQRSAMTNWKDSPEANHSPMRKVSGSNINPWLAPAPLSLTLTGQLVSGKNRVRIRRDGHHYPEKAFINWRAKAYYQILEQHPTRTIITTPVYLTCHYWPGDHAVRDVSGQLDALFHLLVYAKVLKDDGLVYDVKWRRHAVNAKFPRLMLSITGYEEVTT